MCRRAPAIRRFTAWRTRPALLPPRRRHRGAGVSVRRPRGQPLFPHWRGGRSGPRAPRRSWVLGDSITDGVGSTVDGDARWPDALATRLPAKRATASIAVVNAGIAGNRILNDARPPFIGPSSLSRFDRDVLDLPDLVRKVVLSGVSKRRYKKRAREPFGHAPLSPSKNPEPGTHIETSRRGRVRISCRSPW